MIKKTLFLLVSIALVGSASAAWKKVDDFEDDSTLTNWSVTSTGLDVDPAIVPGRVEYVDDPVASGQGKVLAIVNPIGTSQASNSSMTYPLGDAAMKDDIANPDKKQTVYFKLLRPLIGGLPGELNTTIGFMSSEVWAGVSGVSPAVNEAPATIPSWGSYSTIVRYETDGIFDIRDGSTYTNISDTAQDTDAWYEVWMVHTHGEGTFQVYLKGGSDYPTQTLVTEEVVIDNGDGTFTTLFEGNKAKYRVETFEDLDWLFIKPNGGGTDAPEGKDDTFIDDFYIDNDGENLSSPGGATPPTSDAEFYNISTRGNVGTGADRIIGGFVVRGVEGATTGTVLIRAVGPALGALGVPGTLVDPVLEVFDSSSTTVPVHTNDNWGDNAEADVIKVVSAAIGAFALEDGSLDAVLMLSLEPGAYTAIISGKGGTTGVALMEVYAID